MFSHYICQSKTQSHQFMIYFSIASVENYSMTKYAELTSMEQKTENQDMIKPSRKLEMQPRSGLNFSEFLQAGFEVKSVNYDLDHFSVLAKKSNIDVSQIQIRNLVFLSLKLYFNLLTTSKSYEISDEYFIDLQTKAMDSLEYSIEIDYLNTDSAVLFLEAYCYDQNEKLVAKGSLKLIDKMVI